MIRFQAQELEGLHDIIVPEAVAWTPQTVGWYVLLVVGVVIGTWMAAVRHRKHVANRYRREALAALAEIEEEMGETGSRAEALGRIPILMKRVALSAASRAEAASLTGEPWLAYLDAAYGGDGFSNGPGRLLPTIAYEAPERLKSIRDDQAAALLDLARVWIASHDVSRVAGG